MNKTSTTNVTKLLGRLIEAKAETIKLGMDVHADNVVVSVQEDASVPKRPLRMSYEQVLMLVKGLVAAGIKVYSCYETGPCGYHLHRRLLEVGASNYVVAARALSDGRKQKTDALDAAALVYHLGQYLGGYTKAFTVVRVPTPEEEQAKMQAHMRDQLKKSRHQWESRGRSSLLFQGYHVKGRWWAPRPWEALKSTLPEWLVTELTIVRTVLLSIDAEEQKRRATLEKTAPKDLPKAVGALTWVLIAREICNWQRFKNRRQVSSYTGLCPGIEQSGTSKRDGSINRHGNPRVRALLIELVWRLARWQPDYPPVRALVARVARGAARRKLAVAAARKLAVDLWRLATNQTTPEKLKLMVPVAL